MARIQYSPFRRPSCCWFSIEVNVGLNAYLLFRAHVELVNWVIGLVVWFLLRVQEVASSILASPPFLSLSILVYLCISLYFVYIDELSTQDWVIGLVVWFLLRVQEVASSILASPRLFWCSRMQQSHRVGSLLGVSQGSTFFLFLLSNKDQTDNGTRSSRLLVVVVEYTI